MKTNELINILAQVEQPKNPIHIFNFFMGFCALSAMATFLMLGFRPEIMDMNLPLGFWIKTALLFSLSAIIVLFLRDAAMPLPKERAPYSAVIWVAIMTALIIYEWMTKAMSDIFDPALLKNFISCLFFVSLYSGVGVLGLFRIMRHYAPLNMEKAAGLMGLAAANVGALGYSLHCTVDSPTFIIFAYGIPLLASWALSRKYLAPLLSW